MAETATVRVLFLGDAGSALRSTNLISRSFGTLGRTAKLAGVAITAGIVTAMASATSAAISFDREMRNVNSIAKLSEEQFQRLSKQVLGLAKETGQAPKVLAEGLYDIVSSGFEANEAVKILRVSAKAATAGMTDTATATKAINAALNAYHLDASKAKDVSDILFETVNKGVITFEELAQNMGDMVPISAPLGVTLEEVGAAIATITLQGVPAAEAATRVKNVMLQLARPSENLAALLEEAGFQSGEAAIKSEGFVGVLELLDEVTEGNVTKTAALTPEIRALMGIVGLTGKNVKTYKDNLEAMEDATEGAGATSEAFAEQGKSISVQWDKAKAGLTAAGIALATQWFPVIEGAIGLASDFAGWLDRLGKQKTIDAKVKFTVAGVGGLADELGSILLGDPGQRIRVPIDQKHFEWQVVGARQGLLDKMGDFLETTFSEEQMFGSAGRRVRVPVEGGKFEWEIQGAREGWVDALERELDQGIEDIDFTRVGKVLASTGSGIIQVAGVLAVAMAKLVGKAIRDINWGDVGSELAAGMGSAIADAAPKINAELEKTWFDKVGSAFPEDLVLPGGKESSEEARAQLRGIAGWLGIVEDEAGAATISAGLLVDRIAGIPESHRFEIRDNIPSAIGRVEEYRAALNRVASMPPIFKTITTIEERRSVVLGGTSGPPRAMGGFVHGSGPVPMVLHGGEVILNKGQQAAFGGPSFFKRMFGFTGGEGPGFQSGGLYSDAVQRRRDRLERVYGLLQREFGLPSSRGGEEITRGELDRLLANRRALLRISKGLDRRDVRLDIRELRDDFRETRRERGEERREAREESTAAMRAENARLRAALGLQGRQLDVIGAFGQGSLFVPNTGLAMVHRGEQILSAGHVRGGDGAFTPTNVEVILRFDDPKLRDLVRVEAVRMAPTIGAKIGRRADELRRSRRA